MSAVDFFALATCVFTARAMTPLLANVAGTVSLLCMFCAHLFT
jgi:hypothetical protein